MNGVRLVVQQLPEACEAAFPDQPQDVDHVLEERGGVDHGPCHWPVLCIAMASRFDAAGHVMGEEHGSHHW